MEAEGRRFLLGLAAAGPGAAAEFLAAAWRDLADDVRRHPRGHVLALRAGTAPAPRPVLLCAAHLDTVGLVVTGFLPGGLLRFAPHGGADLRALLGREVVIAGRRPVPALVCRAPAAWRAGGLVLDAGLGDADLRAAVRPGDRADFADPVLPLLGASAAGPGLDDRVGVAALHVALAASRDHRPEADLWVVANVGEEGGARGLAPVAAALRPAAALVIDAGIAAQPGVDPLLAPALGRGPALAAGPGLHPALADLVAAEAARLDLPLQRLVVDGPSGTDAWTARTAPGGGVPAALLSIPVRALHSAAETCDLADVEAAGRILAAAAAAAGPGWLGGLARVLRGRSCP